MVHAKSIIKSKVKLTKLIKHSDSHKMSMQMFYSKMSMMAFEHCSPCSHGGGAIVVRTSNW